MAARATTAPPVRFGVDPPADGATTIRLEGRLAVDTAGRIWEALRRALPRSGDVTIDASALDYCDGTGMALLMDLAQTQRGRGGNLEIQGFDERLQDLLDLVGLENDLVAAEPRRHSRTLPEVVGENTLQLLADLRNLLEYVGELTLALGHAALNPRRVRWREVLRACTVAGAFALPVVGLIGFILGWVLAFSSAFIMSRFGADQYLALLIGPAMVRELGPLMTCVILAARSGSAFAAEIGTMKVNEELDALETMGIHPVRFLVTPKLLAVLAMAPLLTIFANVAGIFGGSLVSTYILDQPLAIYTNLLEKSVSITDISLGLIKAVFFGMIVAAIGCIRGLQAERNPTSVGEITTSAVVSGIVLISIADAVIAVIVQVLGV